MDDKTRLRKIIARVIDNDWHFVEFMDDHFAGYGIDEIHDTWFEFVLCNEMVLQAMLLNPSFLKAYFGEELIWDIYDGSGWHVIKDEDFDNPGKMANASPAYIYHAHKILDLILEGNNPLEYFDDKEEE